MKHTLQRYGFALCLSWLVALVAAAQGPPGNRSRLELGRTATMPNSTTSAKNATSLAAKKYPFLQRTTTAPERATTVRPNAVVNEYFREKLIAQTPTSPKTNTPTTEKAAQPTPTDEGRANDRLFSNDKVLVSNIYPNPASEAAEVDYQLGPGAGDVKLTLLNIIGAPIAEYSLARSDRKLRIVTRDMATGYYFYMLTVDGRRVATKKLLVRHQ